MPVPTGVEFAHIGRSLSIKGELSGSEDLYVDGVVEGAIELAKNNLVIGPNGQVRANIQAKGVVVEGKVEGNIRASEWTELRKSAVAAADILTQRIVVEDGALLIGKVNVQPEGAKSAAAKAIEAQAETKPGPAAPRTAGSSAGKT
jgi:cytoskeletal protein CcmA (bactofilin family)